MHAARGAIFIVNDDVALARAVGADGVHLGADDGGIAAARATVGPDRDRRRVVLRRFRAGARPPWPPARDYVAFGSFFASATKPGARRADIGLLARAKALGVPIVAIGGITAGNARELACAGADAVAVIAAVFDASDPAAVGRAARALAGAFG